MDKNVKDFIYSMRDELILFHLLSEEEIEHLLPFLEVVDYPKGATVFKEGEKGDSVVFIAKGIFEVKKQTEFKGKEIVLGKLGRGSIVGELSFVSPEEPRSASVVAMENSQAVLLKRESLDELSEKYPHIGIKIYKGLVRILAIRLRKSIERLSHVF